MFLGLGRCAYMQAYTNMQIKNTIHAYHDIQIRTVGILGLHALFALKN